jgi:hypothetical protein
VASDHSFPENGNRFEIRILCAGTRRENLKNRNRLIAAASKSKKLARLTKYTLGFRQPVICGQSIEKTAGFTKAAIEKNRVISAKNNFAGLDNQENGAEQKND